MSRGSSASARQAYLYDLVDSSDLADAEAAAAERAREEQLRELRAQESGLAQRLVELDALWTRRRQPLEDELEGVRKRLAQLGLELEAWDSEGSDSSEPPGPAALSWVRSNWFAAAGNALLALNLLAMAVAPELNNPPLFAALDHVFLAWYVLELGLKAAYHRQHLFIGRPSVVWWNWLDLLIVVSGVVDQWLLPLFASREECHTWLLRLLRLLRLFRLLRFLKLVKAFLQGDLQWMDSAAFEVFMSGVIAVNSVVMALELDYEWPGWLWMENLFLVIYSFELAVRLKRVGCRYFVEPTDALWNYLDLLMVLAGGFDLWLMPTIRFFQERVLGQAVGANGSLFSKLTSLLKLMRILRVVRLVRLLRTIKPLYRLLLGVIDSLKAMQWVMIFTLLMLYGGAIFWTSLVGKGLIYAGDVPEGVQESFGSVPSSLFSLFRLMNGDVDVVEPVTGTIAGQLLFVGFTVISNWAILAILTSVVSDNMIAASQKAHEEDLQKAKADEQSERLRRLQALFKEIDTDHSGAISEEEWNKLLKDETLLHELCEATGLSERDLRELFACLAVDLRRRSQLRGSSPPAGGRLKYSDESILFYNAFIEHLEDEAAPADKRSVLRVISRIERLEAQMQTRLDEIWGAVTWHFAKGTPRSPGPAATAPLRSPRLAQRLVESAASPGWT